MQKNLTFINIPVGGLFVTGPSERLFIKLNDREGLPNVPGGDAFDIACLGRKVWTPSNRIVSYPKRKHFTAAAKEYIFDKQCEEAQKANEKS